MLNETYWMWCGAVQQRVREGREQKRAQLDERHDYLLSIVAEHLALELTNVEDAILEGSQVTVMILISYFLLSSNSC